MHRHGNPKIPEILIGIRYPRTTAYSACTEFPWYRAKNIDDTSMAADSFIYRLMQPKITPRNRSSSAMGVMMPKLTSIDYNYEKLGQKMVETAIGVLEGKKIPKLQMMEPTLVVRESSGPARAR